MTQHNDAIKREKMKFTLHTKLNMIEAIRYIEELPIEPVMEVVVREHKSKRSLDQNAKMWAMLADISKQVDWYGQKLTAEEWKDVLTAGLKQQRAVPGIEGGFVILGAHTSKMNVQDMRDLIELAQHFGDQQQVKWSAPEWAEELGRQADRGRR